MSDNIAVTPGSGATLGADLCTVNSVANVLVPLNKLGFGVNDSFAYVTSAVGLPANVCQVGGAALALGQQLAAASLPVVLTAAQLSTLTPFSTVAVTGTFFQATQPVSAVSLPLPAGASTEATLSALNGKVTACNTGAVTVSAALPAGTNTIGSVSLAPATSGGLSTAAAITANTTNATTVKASAGQLFGYALFNTTAVPLYVKFYDSASTPTAGSGTPVRRIMVPANSGVERTVPTGLQFSSGIGYTVTGASPDADTTAVAAGACLVNVDYK